MEKKYLKLLRCINNYNESNYGEDKITKAETYEDGNVVLVEVTDTLGTYTAIFESKSFADCTITIKWHAIWKEEEIVDTSSVDKSFILD